MSFNVDDAIKESQMYERIRALIQEDKWLRYYLSVGIVCHFDDSSFVATLYSRCNLCDAVRLWVRRVISMNKTFDSAHAITICANAYHCAKTEEHFALIVGGENAQA